MTQQLGGKSSFLSCLVIISVFCASCAPKIRSFIVTPVTISGNDTVRVNWDVSGHPTLLVHPKTVGSSSDSTTAKYLEFTLVAEKGGKEAKRMVQVIELPEASTDSVVCRTDLHGDTLVAACMKNFVRWGDKFRLSYIRSGSGRPLVVLHDGKIAPLDKNGTPSKALSGSPVNGKWEIRSLLTAAEKADMNTAPEKLSVIISVQYKTP